VGVKTLLSTTRVGRILIYCGRYDDIVLHFISGGSQNTPDMVLFSHLRNRIGLDLSSHYDIPQFRGVLCTFELFLVCVLGGDTHVDPPTRSTAHPTITTSG
jgi:hypothetical protein